MSVVANFESFLMPMAGGEMVPYSNTKLLKNIEEIIPALDFALSELRMEELMAAMMEVVVLRNALGWAGSRRQHRCSHWSA